MNGVLLPGAGHARFMAQKKVIIRGERQLACYGYIN